MVMYVSPLLFTSTGADAFVNAVLINQGRPRQSISNTLDPTMLDTAMSPLPAEEQHVVRMCTPIYILIIFIRKTLDTFVGWF